jgi:hypothetical protein
VDRVAAVFDDKIVDQRAARRNGLRADTGAARNEIALADLGEELLQSTDKRRLAERTIELAKSGLPLFSAHSPEARK